MTDASIVAEPAYDQVNKDPFFDRDLNNFRLLFELRVIDAGVIVTRSSKLQALFKSLGDKVGNKYGSSTTHALEHFAPLEIECSQHLDDVVPLVRMGREKHAGRVAPLVHLVKYWKKKTGYPIFWAAPLVAWKTWVDENPTRAKNFAAAVEESFRWLREPDNFDAAVQKYGQLAGVTTPAAIATYKKLLAQKGIAARAALKAPAPLDQMPRRFPRRSATD